MLNCSGNKFSAQNYTLKKPVFCLDNGEYIIRSLRKNAAVGIDKVSKEEYAVNLEENLTVLLVPRPISFDIFFGNLIFYTARAIF